MEHTSLSDRRGSAGRSTLHYSITWGARPRSDGRMVRPMALAVSRSSDDARDEFAKGYLRQVQRLLSSASNGLEGSPASPRGRAASATRASRGEQMREVSIQRNPDRRFSIATKG